MKFSGVKILQGGGISHFPIDFLHGRVTVIVMNTFRRRLQMS